MDNDDFMQSGAALEALFPGIQRHVWLNHAAISPWPAVVVNALQAFVAENADRGPAGYSRWLRVERQLRDRLARLLVVSDTNDIALINSTSEGLNLIAAGLDWQPGDRMVLPAGEFPSNRLPWLALSARGVEVVEVAFDHDDPESGLIAALNDRTRLLAVSAVRFDTGIRMDLPRLAAACQSTDTLFCIDAIQQLGALPLQPEQIGADFVVAGTHKWLMCPEGLAVFWSRSEARTRLRQVQHGWRMYQDPFQFDREDWRAPESARRFEIGTLNMAGIQALDAACGMFLEFGTEPVAAAVMTRSGWLCEALDSLDQIELVTPADSQRHAGIVSFRHRTKSPPEIVKHLARSDIHAATRGDMVRLSPHFYTPMAQLQEAVERIAAL